LKKVVPQKNITECPREVKFNSEDQHRQTTVDYQSELDPEASFVEKQEVSVINCIIINQILNQGEFYE